ncbi:hypothetical protein J2128_000244 [Methanomicrobium sp. W14]|uniref:hypothetical protein n=1 Tax=Methanomicrobium sp. W14 TaxID=2817839 RepID=UPI001AE51425|nr:hypothetical protein [Methanomicrobium sp. W14]MBP2132323.1 hypothetical protein [Methanomicrobium sp. W14]
MKKDKSFSIKLIALLILCSAFFILPVSANDFKPDFDWDIYKINTDDWAGYSDYNAYSGTIYKVNFYDKTKGGRVSSWKWEFGSDDWTGSTKQDPVKIFTEKEVKDQDYTIEVTLTVVSTDGDYEQTTNTVFFDSNDPWNLKEIHVLTPKPTATPTTIATTVPTTEPTPEPTPTPVPTPKASHTFSLGGISKEMTKLQDSFGDYIVVIKGFFNSLGISV